MIKFKEVSHYIDHSTNYISYVSFFYSLNTLDNNKVKVLFGKYDLNKNLNYGKRRICKNFNRDLKELAEEINPKKFHQIRYEKI